MLRSMPWIALLTLLFTFSNAGHILQSICYSPSSNELASPLSTFSTTPIISNLTVPRPTTLTSTPPLITPRQLTLQIGRRGLCSFRQAVAIAQALRLKIQFLRNYEPSLAFDPRTFNHAGPNRWNIEMWHQVRHTPSDARRSMTIQEAIAVLYKLAEEELQGAAAFTISAAADGNGGQMAVIARGDVYFWRNA